MGKTFFLLTFGCQMNKNDSERIVGFLLSSGLKQVAQPTEADILIINTCSVRQAAEDRVVGMVFNWQELRKTKPNLIIAITGCMPGRDKDWEIKNKMKGVDLFFGIDELPLLPARLRGLWPEENFGEAVGTFDPASFDYLKIFPIRKNNYQAFVTIQTGCNNFCTYCVVPAARGRERNRTVKDILSEIKSAATGGAVEVVLLGQVVNHYIAPDSEHFSPRNPFVSQSSFPPCLPAGRRKRESSGDDRGDDFAALLWEVNQVDGIERINWTAADPQYFSDYQIEALNLPKQVNYLHLPVQSGDNEILKKMNRHYTREKYIELIKKIRVSRPEIAIGTDLIVGFCGESEEQFQNTVDLYKQCDFDIAYQSMYSERSSTPAASAFVDNIPRTEKKRRWQVIQDLMEDTVYRKNKKYAGQMVPVLVESCANGVCSGNSSEMKLTQFLGEPDLIGKIVPVKITQAEMWVLRGVLTL